MVDCADILLSPLADVIGKQVAVRLNSGIDYRGESPTTPPPPPHASSTG
jgi:hypothetical protein